MPGKAPGSLWRVNIMEKAGVNNMSRLFLLFAFLQLKFVDRLKDQCIPCSEATDALGVSLAAPCLR